MSTSHCIIWLAPCTQPNFLVRNAGQRFVNYLGQAKASCGETRSVCYVAKDCGYIDQEKFKKLYTLSTKISGKIKRFMDYLENYDSNDRIKEAMVEYKSC